MPSMAWITNVPEFTHRIRGHLVFEGSVSSRCEGAVSQDVLKVLLEKVASGVLSAVVLVVGHLDMVEQLSLFQEFIQSQLPEVIC